MPTNEPSHRSPQFVDVFELRFIGAALRRHAWVVLAVGGLGVVLGWGFTTMSPPVYRAEAVILVNIQSLKINAQGEMLDVEVVRPARRLIGTVCESDHAMALLADRFASELPTEAGADQASRVAWLREHIYYDQRGLEMAALRAFSTDPQQAAALANAWAQVCRRALREAYGTTDEDILDLEAELTKAHQDVLDTTKAHSELPSDATESQRLAARADLDKAKRLHEGFNERWAQLKVRRTDSEEIARVISPASPPAHSINQSPKVVIGLFGFAGLLMGWAVALLRGPGVKA